MNFYKLYFTRYFFLSQVVDSRTSFADYSITEKVFESNKFSFRARTIAFPPFSGSSSRYFFPYQEKRSLQFFTIFNNKTFPQFFFLPFSISLHSTNSPKFDFSWYQLFARRPNLAPMWVFNFNFFLFFFYPMFTQRFFLSIFFKRINDYT